MRIPSPHVAPLINAAFDGDLDEVRRLIDAGHPVDAGGRHGGTPLHAAVENGQQEVLQLLLDRGADVNLKGSASWTPLAHAVDVACCKVTDLRLPGLDATDIEMVRTLLARGADPTLISQLAHSRETPASLATMYGERDLATFLRVMELAYLGSTPEQISRKLGLAVAEVTACLDFVAGRPVARRE